MTPAAPPSPAPPELNPDDPKTVLYERLRTVLLGLPSFFEFNNHVAGVNATDLHSLNTLLGTSIENQVVKALNAQRRIWDPDDHWLGYTFERQSQAFPDVRLMRRDDSGPDVALGVELKGWFLMAKEGKPSFRFVTTPKACADHDLIVVVPWYLDNVLSGSPVAAQPFIASARWAAEFRNYWWEHVRTSKPGHSSRIDHPDGAYPYPVAGVNIADLPRYDGGKNFGRLARVVDLMDAFVTQSMELEALGIRIADWRSFLAMHRDQADRDKVSERLRQRLARKVTKRSVTHADDIASAVEQLAQVLDAPG